MRSYLYLLITLYLSATAIAQNLSWSKVDLNVGDSVNTIFQDKSGRLIIQSEKGTFIVKNLTETTRIDTFLPDTMKISCLTLDTNGIIYAGTYEDGVWVFSESNKQWIFFSDKLENQNVRRIAISNTEDIVVATTKVALYRFKNADSTWSLINSMGSDKYFSVLKFNESGDLFISDESDIEIQENGQNTWKTFYDILQYPAKIKNLTIYGNTIYVSTDICSILRKYHLTDAWDKLYEGLGVDINITDVLITQNEEIIALTNSLGVYYSNNQGTSFEENNTGFPESKLILCGLLLLDKRILISTGGNGFYISDPPKNNPIKPGGWIDKGKFLERKAHDGSITGLLFNKDNSKIYTSGWDKKIKIWDFVTGELMDSIDMPYNISSMDLSPQENQLAVGFLVEDSHKAKACIFNYLERRYGKWMDLDTLYPVNNGFDFPTEYYENNVKFLYEDSLVMIGSGADLWEGGDSRTGGSLDLWDFKAETELKNYSFGLVINSFDINKESGIIVYSGWHSWARAQSHGGGRGWLSRVYLLNLFTNDKRILFEEDSCGNDCPKVISVSLAPNNTLLSFGLNTSDLYLYNFSSDKIIQRLTGKVAKFTRNQTYIIICDDDDHEYNKRNAVVKIYHIASNTIVDSCIFGRRNYRWKLSISTDSTHFATGSSDGMLRLWSPSIITGINESIPPGKEENLLISPNPATDYIEISDINPPAILWAENPIPIYNTLGEIVLAAGAIHELPLRIDVSTLPPGLYFVRLGNITRKFVKI